MSIFKIKVMSNIKVRNANYLKNYEIQLHFATNERMTVDLEHFLSKDQFSDLKDKEVFKNFKIEDGNLVWENGAEFSANFLYSRPSEDELSCV